MNMALLQRDNRGDLTHDVGAMPIMAVDLGETPTLPAPPRPGRWNG